jgi:2'-5' RNA ligase
LSALATVVTRSTAGIGDAARDDFVGHITLARLRRDAPVPRIVGTRFGVEFDVDELALVSSRLTPTGAIYETITRWPVVSE